MKIKIGVYGGTHLPPKLVLLVKSITKHLLHFPEVILVTGGYYYKEGFKHRQSTDKVVMETAEAILGYPAFNDRFETWLAQDNDRADVIRFEKGKVILLPGSTQSRRFKQIRAIDGLITVMGEGNTINVVELALAINKPVLPMAFTGGDSKETWQKYRPDIIKSLNMPERLAKELQLMPTNARAINAIAKKAADFLFDAIKKTCLVLMPFEAAGIGFYDNYLKPAIDESNYSSHRIDRNDPAGNIPAIFRTSVEKAGAIIVDITGYNANVMYELGHLHAKNITPLIVQRIKNGQQNAIGSLPFYLRQEMIVRVNDNAAGHKKIQQAVKAWLQQLN